MILLEWLKQTLFSRKLVQDARSIEANAIVALELPQAFVSLFGGKDDDVGQASKTICGLLPPDFGFYYQLVVIVLFQSLFNAVLGALLYTLVVQPQRQQQQSSPPPPPQTSSAQGLGDGVDKQYRKEPKDFFSSSGMAAFLFAFGIALPCVVLEPIFAIRALEIRNAGLIMAILATPIVNSLRITEALYGFAPELAQSSLWNYVVYFSCLFGMEFDASTRTPKRVSTAFFRRRLATLGRDFGIVSLVICILKPYDYEFFEYTQTSVDSMDHTLMEMVSWKHLLNNFLVAFLISASLSQSSLGVSLIYNIVYQVQTYEVVLNPMFLSKSPSDFWGRRWNMLVHKCLKNGVYKPTRLYTSSKMWAVVATFVVSGIIHEYVNYVMFAGYVGATNEAMMESSTSTTYRFTWKQMLFFGWNGVLLLLEYSIGHWKIFQWMSQTLPSIVITALVLCCALPLAHLFTGDWIKHGYFDAVYLAEPIVVCQRY